jgi:hypothetical protein
VFLYAFDLLELDGRDLRDKMPKSLAGCARRPMI